MRKFFSYGPVNPRLHYCVPRQELINKTMQQLLGDDPNEGGHYITIWAPRQTGKTWLMREVRSQIQQSTQFDVVFLGLQFLDAVTEVDQVAQLIAKKLIKQLNLSVNINTLNDFDLLFERGTLTKPLILILDEFDALPEIAINHLVSVFRHIYNTRQISQNHTAEKEYLLHSLALIGVRTVLGIENVRGSPFNVQRSVHIPNLTHPEVIELFNQYQQETGQPIEPEVVEGIWYEFQGQPGLTCWFGELLTQTYNQTIEQPITMAHFKAVYAAALDLLHNNNILNIISKAKQEPYKPYVLELFQTEAKIKFTYRAPIINFLYMNGVISVDQVSFNEHYVKFTCPYVQKQLFSYFAEELYHEQMVELHDPFDDLSDTITHETLNVLQLLRRYERHLQANRDLVLKNAPRREDLRVYEAVFHFHFYLYLTNFLSDYEAAQVQPEFPTGNGKIDLLIRHAGQLFGLELKSFASIQKYQQALTQAANYGKQLGLSDIWLVLFIETVDDQNRQRFEVAYTESDVTVHPIFIQTGN